MEHNFSSSEMWAKLQELAPIYSEIAAKKAAQSGVTLRCEFMCSNLSGARKLIKRTTNKINILNDVGEAVGETEESIIVAQWSSHPFVTGSIQDFADDITRIIGIFTAPNAPTEHAEMDAESLVIHENSALHHANKIIQSGRLRYRKTTSLYVQDTLTGLAVTVHSDELNIWDLQSAAHIKLATYIEKARNHSREASRQS